jgi:hypothetical protein
VKLARKDSIGAQGSSTLLRLAVGTELKGAGDRARGDRGGLGNWIGEGMLDVVNVLPRVGEGCAPAEEMGVAIT